MHKLHPHRTGLVVGVFVGLAHLVWSLLLSLEIAASKLNFFLGMHFLSIPFTVLPFSWKGGLLLVFLSIIGGYIAGTVFSFIWNKIAVHN